MFDYGYKQEGVQGSLCYSLQQEVKLDGNEHSFISLLICGFEQLKAAAVLFSHFYKSIFVNRVH